MELKYQVPDTGLSKIRKAVKDLNVKFLENLESPTFLWSDARVRYNFWLCNGVCTHVYNKSRFRNAGMHRISLEVATSLILESANVRGWVPGPMQDHEALALFAGIIF